MKRLWILGGLLALLLAACNTSTTPNLGEVSTQAVKDRYIVVLKEEASPGRADANRTRAVQVARGLGLEPFHAYGAALVGFAAVIPEGRLNAVMRDPNVAYVEADRVMRISAQEMPTGIKRIYADTVKNSGGVVVINGDDDVRVDVDVAVIDTGIDFEHRDLNVAGGVDCISQRRDILFGVTPTCDPGGDDDHYHGTHVAGTVGALDNGEGVVGVAPGARLWAVKVLNSQGSGYNADIVAGIEWVTAQANKVNDIEVANMSLGGAGTSAATDKAIAGAVAEGVVIVVAAGNSSDEAANYTPANSPKAFTVSALADFDGLPDARITDTSSYCRADEDDTLANFSNFDSSGSVINIAAPGVCILSTYPIEQGNYGTISGTSMASPHVAGAAAILASGSNKPTNEAGVDAITSKLATYGNLNWTDDSKESPNKFKEPLLDVSNATIFTAQTKLTGTSGGSEPSPNISLSVLGYVKGKQQRVDLTWSGASSTNVDVWRNGALITTTANDGKHTDTVTSSGSYTYTVCEVGTDTCSNQATVTF